MGHAKLPLVEMTSPFACLESLTDHRLYILPIEDEKPLKIGRGHECGMTIQDSAISRVQASIEFREGQFVLSDHGSRFGTYVKIIKELALQVGEQVSVQIGRTILQLSVKSGTSSTKFETLNMLRGEEEASESQPEGGFDSPRGKTCSMAGCGDGGESSESGAIAHSISQEGFYSCDSGIP